MPPEGGPAVCSGDEEVQEDAQPDVSPQPTPTYDEDTGVVATGAEPETIEKFPLVPVAAGAGVLVLIAALA